tara:strand:- start:69 stop:221 length:153 start_codon:yes stop_codon:yes gene_type:complete
MSAPSGDILGFLSTGTLYKISGELLVFGDFLIILIIFFGIMFTLVEIDMF